MFSFYEFEDMCEKLAEEWRYAEKVRPVSSEKAFAQTVHTISVYSNNSEESPLYEESILAKLREFAPVLSNLR